MPFSILRRLVLKGEEQTQTSEIAGDLLRIGRGTSNDLHLDDFSVSFTHATIERVEGRYVLRDLTGVGALYVNHAPVREATVGHGDSIRIGPYSLRLSVASPDAPLTILVEQDVESKGREKDAVVALLPQHVLSTGRWTKTTIAVIASCAVLGVAVLTFAFGKQRVFMPGEVSMKHRLFAGDCVRCHTPWKPVWVVVPDKTCKTCHGGPTHFGDRSLMPSPSCASCHVEHKGQVFLAATPDSVCVQCHADLKAKEGGLPIAGKVQSFSAGHPEFAVSVSRPGQETPQRVRLNEKGRLVDTASMKLNHKLHLQPDLMGPDGPEPLVCASCHSPDQRGAYMRPVSYEKDCRRCHLLDFDERFPGKTAPHGQQPEEIHRYLRTAYAEFYLLDHQTEMRGRGPARRLPGGPKSKEEIWVDQMVEKAEWFLFRKTGPKSKQGKCVLCHTLEPPGDGPGRHQVANRPATSQKPVPVVAKTAMPQRWLPNSVFDHTAHNTLKCVACHEAAPRSETTTDVLLPGVASCRTCHFEPGGARAQCVECHLYHDKTKLRQPEQPYTIEQLKKGRVRFDGQGASRTG